MLFQGRNRAEPHPGDGRDDEREAADQRRNREGLLDQFPNATVLVLEARLQVALEQSTPPGRDLTFGLGILPRNPKVPRTLRKDAAVQIIKPLLLSDGLLR